MESFDAVVLGLGPAGIAASIELAQRGHRIAVIDESPEPGGRIYRKPPSEFHVIQHWDRHKAGEHLLARFEDISDSIRVFSRTQVWGCFDNSTLTAIRDGRTLEMNFRNLIICEGAMERVIPFSGWTLPGVMTVGGLQKILLNQRILPGRKVILSGTGPLLVAVGSALIRCGAQSVDICDATGWVENLILLPKILQHSFLLQEALTYWKPLLFSRRVHFHRHQAVVSVSGKDKVESAVITRLDQQWRPMPGSEKTIETDIVGVHHGFLPANRLTRLCGCSHVYDSRQLCFRPDVDAYGRCGGENLYVAGDAAGIGGAILAEIRGKIAGLHVAFRLEGKEDSAFLDEILSLQKRQKKLRQWNDALTRVFTPKKGLYEAIKDDTIVCRCEGVQAGVIRNAVASGMDNINEIKHTRFAMGHCQGRVCESVVLEFIRLSGIPMERIGILNVRPPMIPIPSSALENFVKEHLAV
ncbi:MAG TPA: FAD-binding protein [Desulfobacteraceae bacterium]|nr:FAD-binding protein [Desulfobacteraceae bacterium]